MNKEKDLTLAHFMGFIFIIIGVIATIIIVSSFDFATYGELKDETYLLAEEELELQMLQSEHTMTWALGLGALIINLAVGTVLISLGKIVRILEDIRDKK